MMNQTLLVEGKNDLHVLSNIFGKHTVKKTFETKDKDSIYRSIPIYLKTDIVTLGIIIDAGDNLSGKWEKLRNILSKSGYSIQDSPSLSGTIIKKDDSPTVGIWIMPDNNTNGMLEDFVKQLIPNDDSLIYFVNKSLDEIESNSVNKYKAVHKSKARIHTWLAWQETPGTPMGLAIKKMWLDTDSELCLKFIDWINKLYN